MNSWQQCRKCDPFYQNETLLCTWSKLSSLCIIKVCILPFIMVFRILKSDNPKWSYAHSTIGLLKSMEWRNRLSKFGVNHWVNDQAGQKSSKLHHLFFKFGSKTFSVHSKHTNNYDLAKIWKPKKSSSQVFKPYLHLGSCTEASHLDGMDHKYVWR